MNTIRGTVKNRQVVVEAPADWPDGVEVEVTPLAPPSGKIGLEESEWRDDPEALADWEAWIKTVEPLEFAPQEEAALARFNDEMRRFNIEAVRRQMEEEPDE